MSCLTIFLVAAFAAVIPIDAKIPSYIKTCSRNHPQIGECVRNSIQDLRERLVQGIPELAVPSIDPMVFDKVLVELGAGLNTVITELKLIGLHQFIFDYVSVNLTEDTYLFNISVPQLTAYGTYDIDAKLGGIPLKGKGPLYLKPGFVTGRGMLQGRRVVRGGKTYYYFPKMTLKLNVKDYEIRLDNLFGGDPTIGNATNKLLNEEKNEVLSTLIPGVEKAVVEKVLLIGNNICKYFTWDELFPES